MRRRTQCYTHRLPRLGKIDARQATPLHLASAKPSRSTRNHKDTLGSRHAATRSHAHDMPPVPLAPPHHLPGGSRGWRHKPHSRRDFTRPQRHTFPRRVARIQPASARSDAPAARRPPHHHQPRQIQHRIPRIVHARGIDEPMSLRLLHPPHQALYLPTRTGATLPQQNLRSAPRPHRHSDRSAAGAIRRHVIDRASREQ